MGSPGHGWAGRHTSLGPCSIPHRSDPTASLLPGPAGATGWARVSSGPTRLLVKCQLLSWPRPLCPPPTPLSSPTPAACWPHYPLHARAGQRLARLGAQQRVTQMPLVSPALPRLLPPPRCPFCRAGCSARPVAEWWCWAGAGPAGRPAEGGAGCFPAVSFFSSSGWAGSSLGQASFHAK